LPEWDCPLLETLASYRGRREAGKGTEERWLMTDLRKLFEYESWASRRLLARLSEIERLDPEVRKLFAHVQAGLRVWIMRIRGEDSRAVPIWPDLTLAGCADLIDQNERAYAELLEQTSEELLARKVSYTNQHGLSYRTAVGDILWHVITHGGYHRGQIARLLRQGREEPVNTDYITYVRELAGEPWKP
jgi:uncharacterized damage-inducible protein DinB